MAREHSYGLINSYMYRSEPVIALKAGQTGLDFEERNVDAPDDLVV